MFLNKDNDNLIVLDIDGITCAHCAKIVETVLQGCTGKSTISGLLNAAADRDLSCAVIQIDDAKNAKRIAFEATQNLALVGYKATPKEVSLPSSKGKKRWEIAALTKSVEYLAKVYPLDYFSFAASCTCPHGGVYKDNCLR